MSYIARASSGYLPTLSTTVLAKQNEAMTLEDNKSFTSPLPDSQSNSALLKQRLEMYWHEMAKYQKEIERETHSKAAQQTPQNETEMNHQESNSSCIDVLQNQSPEVIEQAKNIVRALLEKDNLQNNIQLPWTSEKSPSQNGGKSYLNGLMLPPPPVVYSSSQDNNIHSPHKQSTSRNVPALSPNLTNSSSVPRKPSEQQPLDLTVPLMGKKRPISEANKPSPFRNAHLPIRQIQPLLDENRNAVYKPTTSDNSKPQQPRPQQPFNNGITPKPAVDYQHLIQAGMSPAQATHLQHWLGSLPNMQNQMHPLAILQQQQHQALAQQTEEVIQKKRLKTVICLYIQLRHYFTNNFIIV